MKERGVVIPALSFEPSVRLKFGEPSRQSTRFRVTCTLAALLIPASLLAQTGREQRSTAPTVARSTKLTNIETSYPSWSPDGRRIVYQSNRTGNSEIYVMDAEGTGAVQLTHHPAADEQPAWSPDGQRIAFRTYRDGNAEIYTMAPDGTDLRNLTRNAADDIHPTWSKDGSRILFNSNRSLDPSGKPLLTIHTMRSDGSDVQQVSRGLLEETYAHLSPDGSRIVFRRKLDEQTPGWTRSPGNSEIFVMRSDGDDPRRLTTHPGFDGWPSWSPDGEWIVFASERTGDFQIHLVRPDGTDTRRLTDGPGNFTKPIYSPDGRRIVCTRTLDGNVEIFVIDLTDSSPGTSAVFGTARTLPAAGSGRHGWPAHASSTPHRDAWKASLGRKAGSDDP